MRKNAIFLTAASALLCMGSSCQEEYITEIEDKPTDTIDFYGITASRDTVCMFDTIVLSANAKGENLRYRWQRVKGSMASVKGEPDKVYFWGCQTCCGDISISCTVENEYGAYTKDVRVFVYPWYRWQQPWPDEIFKAWLEHNNKKK